MKNNTDELKIKNALKRCGIKKGDILFLHTDISKLNNFKSDLKQQLETYFEAIKSIVGVNGTIIVPAFYFEYSKRKKSFIIPGSPISKELGIFPNFFCKQKNVQRSLNPLTSVAAMGKHAKYICKGDNVSSYGVDSPFDKLTKLNAKMLFVGVDCRAMNYIHYIEYMVGVPHVYNKLFKIPIYYKGKKINLPVCNQVRYLNYNVTYDKFTNTKKFERAGLVKKVKIGNGYIRTLNFVETFNFCKKKLQKNFYYFLKRSPNFKKNYIPLI